jgi:two-component system cell cycle response regulator
VTEKPKVLMIDNARMMHGVVRARLVADGMEFYSAFSGDEGLVTARTVRPDAILLDVEMPTPNGFEVCRRLKEDPEFANTPVIFLTGVSSTEEKIRGLNLGAIDYVTKPFDAAELQARVRAALRNKELLDLLAKKAMIDGLTGLYNRGYLNQRLAEELAHARRYNRPMSCVMLDVDHFKAINDTHGHGFGDFVLKEIAGVLQQHCRMEDIPCRYGGEEFAVLARETEARGVMPFAERLRTAIAATPFSRGAISVSVTVSLGVSDLASGADELIEHADRAMYGSKRDGRNRATLYAPAITAAA